MGGLILEKLSKTFRQGKKQVHALQEMSLTVLPNEMLVLLGPSGSGKTTTLRLIAGLEEPASGEIILEGKSLRGVKPALREMAMVFQHFALYPHLTVRENLAFPLTLQKLSTAETADRVLKIARQIKMESWLDVLPETLSGGEQQRVALGKALIRKPKLFLYDEPLSNLDLPNRIALRREIAQVHQQSGVPSVYVTHDQTEALALASKIGVMREGKLLQLGTPTEIYNHPNSLFVAQFVGTQPINLIPGATESSRQISILCPSGKKLGMPTHADLDQGRAVTVGIRPEDIHIQPVGSNSFPMNGIVKRVEWLGSETFALVEMEGFEAITVKIPNQTRPASGEIMPLFINLEKIHLFDHKSGDRISFIKK